MIQVDNEKALRDALVSCSGDIELTRSFPVSEPIVITGRAQIRGAGLSANSCEGAVVLFRAPAFFDIMVSVEGGDAVFKNLVIDGTFQSDRNSGKDIEAIFYLSAGSLTLDESVRLKNRARENHRDENFSASPAGSSSNTCMPQFSDNIHVKSFRSAAREDGIFGSPPADLSGKISVQPSPLLSTEPSEKIPHLLLLPENTSSAPVRPFPSMAETTFTKGFRITFRGGCDHTFPAARFLRLLCRRGIAVPQSAGIAAYDSHSLLTDFLSPSLTTMDPEIAAMTREALQLAGSIKAGKPLFGKMTKAVFVPGESAYCQ